MKKNIFCLMLIFCFKATALQIVTLEKEGSTITLIGLHHNVTSKHMDIVFPRLSKEINNANIVFFESDPKLRSDESYIKHLETAITQPNSIKLKKYLGNSAYELAIKYLQSHPLPENAIDIYTPWFLASYLVDSSQKPEGEELIIDVILNNYASYFKKEVRYLEKPIKVLEAYNKLPEGGVKFFNAELHSSEKFAFVDDWASGDGKESYLYYLERMKNSEYAEFNKHLLIGRNRAWLEVINNSKADNILIFVGFLHLYGNSGLINLLQSNDSQATDETTQ